MKTESFDNKDSPFMRTAGYTVHVASSPLLPLLTSIPLLCPANRSPLLMPFLEACLHKAGNLISTFPEGKCPVTSVKHLQAGRALLQSQQALTGFKQSLTGNLCLQRISELLSPLLWRGWETGPGTCNSLPLPLQGGTRIPLSRGSRETIGSAPQQWEMTNCRPKPQILIQVAPCET